VVRGFIPAWKTLNTDFPNYYLAAVLHHDGIPLDRAYEWTWYERQKDRLGIEQSLVGFVPHPPLCAAPILPLAGLPSLQAKRVWLILNLLFLLGAVWLLSRATALRFPRTLLIALLCIVPLRANFLFGQLYVLILLLICAALYAHAKGLRFTSGLLIAAAGSLKIFPAGFLLLFLWKRDWRAAFGVVCGIALFLITSIALFGVPVHRVFLHEVLTRAMVGEIVDPYVTRSLTGIWAHLFLFEPTMNPAPLFPSPFLAALLKSITTALLLVSFLLTVRRADESKRNLEWAGFIVLLLLLSTMPATYHYCVLIGAAVLGFAHLEHAGRHRLAIALCVSYAIAFAPLRVPGLTLVMAVAVFVVLIIGSGIEGASAGSRTALISAALLFICASTLVNDRSLQKQHREYLDRLADGNRGIYAGNPAAIAEGTLIDVMMPTRYKAVIMTKSGRTDVQAESDVLAVTGSPKSVAEFIEIAGTVPIIARIEPPDYQPKPLFEGQQPSLSSNGKWLAFIREDHGKGSAWITSTDSAEPVRLTAAGDNVLELSVSDKGTVVVALGPVGDSKLAIIESTKNAALIPLSGVVRYPAISAEGERLVFSRRLSGSWNLVLYSLKDHKETSLMDYPCNATEPSWADDHTILYASDCGRGIGFTAIAKIGVP